jgi:hypothetical protein
MKILLCFKITIKKSFGQIELAFRDDVRTLAETRDPEFEEIISNIKRINELSEDKFKEQHLDLAA